MSNAELIERLNKPCGRTTGHGESCSVGWLCGACADKAKAADALELADKRIAEEREQHDIMMERGAEKLAEAERKLSVAREALKYAANELAYFGVTLGSAEEALAQIGGEDARS